jgi:hypothetical protein
VFRAGPEPDEPGRYLAKPGEYAAEEEDGRRRTGPFARELALEHDALEQPLGVLDNHGGPLPASLEDHHVGMEPTAPRLTAGSLIDLCFNRRKVTADEQRRAVWRPRMPATDSSLSGLCPLQAVNRG